MIGDIVWILTGFTSRHYFYITIPKGNSGKFGSLVIQILHIYEFVHDTEHLDAYTHTYMDMHIYTQV
jgi:hypothetical protein